MINCPHCKKEIPEQLLFCPFCMERLNSPKTVTPQADKRKRFPIILPVLLLCTVILAIGVYFLTQNKNVPPVITDSTKTDDTVTDLPAAEDTIKEPEVTVTEPEGTVTEPEVTVTEEQNTPVAKPQTEAVTPNEMAGRWNRANSDLYLWNYTLNGYTANESPDSSSISQHFNSCGADIEFTFDNELKSFEATVTNIENRQIIYDVCRLVLASVATKEYIDSEFYTMISEGNPNNISGIYAGYEFTLEITENNLSDEWGLSYTRYECTFKGNIL